MSIPTLTPASKVSAIALPVTGTLSDTVAYNDHSVNTSSPYKIYSSTDSALFDANYVTGAVSQVAYVYKKLGGDVLDIELTEGSVYSAYEEATLEYSYIMNIHQANNVLARALGDTTGSFDDKGEMVDSAFSASYGQNDSAHGAAPGISLKYPKFNFDYLRRIAGAASAEVGLGDSAEYSGSFDIIAGEQDYDLQAIMESATGEEFTNKINGKKILVKDIMYKTPHAMWRFYGYYGGLNALPLGNIPYKNINSIGKQWIRRFALALCKETLGQVRSKFGGVPLPGESLQMNGSDLISQAQTEQKELREELKTTLAELTYTKLAEQEAALAESAGKSLSLVPNMDNIYVG
jgi:hypothetical protein